MAVDIDKAREELLLLRNQLQGEDERLTTSLAMSLEDQSGDESSDQHPADVGTITFTRELDASLQDNTEHLLAQVERALEKIDQGTYGICDRCGRPIEADRLRAVPYAALCLDDKKRLEQAERF